MDKALKDEIKHGYHYLDCPPGYWKCGFNKINDISKMDDEYKNNCRKMVERATTGVNDIPRLSKESKEILLQLMYDKIEELE